MNTRTLLNLFLIAAILILALIISNTREQDSQTLHLTELQRAQINRIVIPRDKGDIVIEKLADTQWRMTSPYQVRAHQFRIDRLLDMATSSIEKHYPFQADKAQQFGIDAQSSRIIFNDTEIVFGNKNPLNEQRYAKVGDQLSLINDELYPLINAQPSSFAALHLIEPEQQIKAIDIDQQFRVYRDDAGRWRSTANQTYDADSLVSFINEWQNAQAFGVHAYMPRKKLGHITIRLNDDSEIDLQISDTQPWLILGRPKLGIEYHFDNQFNKLLLALPEPATDPTRKDNDA